MLGGSCSSPAVQVIIQSVVRGVPVEPARWKEEVVPHFWLFGLGTFVGMFVLCCLPAAVPMGWPGALVGCTALMWQPTPVVVACVCVCLGGGVQLAQWAFAAVDPPPLPPQAIKWLP